MRNDLYRLLCLRYLFLIPLGMEWARRGVRLTPLTLALSCISLLFITLFRYGGVTLEPFFFFSIYSWEDCHWICYFYPAFLFMFFLHWTFKKLPKCARAAVIEIGHYSWHVFLLQMCFFALFPKGRFMEMGSYYPMLALYSLIAFACSIIPVICWHRYRKHQNQPIIKSVEQDGNR